MTGGDSVETMEVVRAMEEEKPDPIQINNPEE